MYSKAKTAKKAGQGWFTFALTYILITIATNPEIIIQHIPESIRNMTIGGFLSGFIVATANWLKQKNKK